ncbi:MAG: sulfatase family protein [Bryobacteraceae bacterium]
MNKVSRRGFLGWGASAAQLESGGADTLPPNVLFLMTDQHRFDALSCAGNPIVETPNLDRLARQGVRFTRAVCSSPLCGPSRASLLSGQYQHGHRCSGNAEISKAGMPESVDTWDEILARRGYHTEYHGKWHTGSANRSHYADGLPYYLKLYHDYLAGKYPGRRPRDGEAIDRYTHWPYRYLPVDRMMLRATKEGLDMPHHNEAGEHTVPAEESLTAWTVTRVIDFLRRKPPRPFCVTCSILQPHAPLIATRPYCGLYDPARIPLPAPGEDVFTPSDRAAIPKVLTRTPDGLGTFISLYYGLIKEVDDWTGRLLDALDENGYAENTLVVFTSDHGEMLGEHARVSKMVFYEGSLRVPLILRLPGRIPKGRQLAHIASGADLAPTILDYLGVSAPSGMHGRSLKPVIEGRRSEWDFAYSEVRANPRMPNAQRILRTAEWKLVFKGGESFLYDLEKDRNESRNLLSAAHRQSRWIDEARRLQRRMLARLEEMRSPELDVVRSFAI